MNVPELFIAARKTTLSMSVFLLSGLIGYRLLRDDLPSVDYPTIQVRRVLPGANPETIFRPCDAIGEQFSIIAGVDSMSSVSTLGSVQITIQFTHGSQH